MRRLALLIVLALPTQAFASVVDLRAVLFAPPATRAGGTGHWFIGVTNGRQPPTDWHVVFPIPAGTTFVSATPEMNIGTCAVTETSVECSGTTFDIGAEFDVVLAVSPTAAGPIHSTVSVTTSDTEADPSNDTASADTILVTQSNFAIGIGIDRLEPKGFPGEKVTVRAQVINNGPDVATDVTLDLTLPPGAVVLPLTRTNFDFCTPPPIRCVAKVLNVGATGAYVEVPFIVPSTPGTYPLTSDVSWTNLNVPPETMHFAWPFEVDPPPPTADLAIIVEAQPAVVSAPGLVTYAVSVTNAGNAPASAVTVQSPFTSLEYLSSSAHCTATPALSCVFGTLASGGWDTFTITARATEPGTVATAFTAATASAEPHTSNNTATATIVVNAPAAPPARRRAARH
jgi:uncharacterized repeat protein (TIGR01451 family)